MPYTHEPHALMTPRWMTDPQQRAEFQRRAQIIVEKYRALPFDTQSDRLFHMYQALRGLRGVFRRGQVGEGGRRWGFWCRGHKAQKALARRIAQEGMQRREFNRLIRKGIRPFEPINAGLRRPKASARPDGWLEA